MQKYQKLLVEIIELEDENPGLTRLRPQRLSDTIAATRKVLEEVPSRYRVVPRPGLLKVEVQRSRDAVELKESLDDPKVHDPIKKITERLGEAMRAAQTDLQSVDVGRLVKTMMRVIPNKAESNELADRVGPFYDTAGLTTWLGKSRQALDKKISSGKLLACMTSDRVRLYPVWQFTDTGELLPGLADVLSALRHGTDDGWTQAVWLLTPTAELGGSALDWLISQNDPTPVVLLARDDATVWAA